MVSDATSANIPLKHCVKCKLVAISNAVVELKRCTGKDYNIIPGKHKHFSRELLSLATCLHAYISI